MPWNLSEFDRKRLEKGRRLLESEEHRGSRDLQLYVEGKDLTVQLHRIFVDDRGQRRRGLTDQEKLQGLVVHMLMVLRNLSPVFCHYVVYEECDLAFEDADEDLRKSSVPWVNELIGIACAGVSSLQATTMPPDNLWDIVEHAADLTSQPSFPASFAALELHQRDSGFDPVLSAADMRLLALYLQQHAAIGVVRLHPDASVAQQWLGAGLSANRQLLQLDPRAAACLHLKRGILLSYLNRHSEAMAAYRSALREAPEHKSHIVEAKAAQQLAAGLAAGHAGPRWSVEEVRGLLNTAKVALAKCKWMPPELFNAKKVGIVETTRSVETAAAQSPRAAMLPAVGGEVGRNVEIEIPLCSGCGRVSSTLKKCSSCQVAAYCSRACQVRHWKEGGHKQECAQLVAGSSGGAGSSRS